MSSALVGTGDEVEEGGAPTRSVKALFGRLLVHAPAEARRFMRIATASWTFVVAVQLWDVAGRSGTSVIAELASVVLGAIGFVVLGTAHVLHVTTRRVAQWPGDGTAPRFEPEAIDEVLVALPLMAFVSGVMFSGALGGTVVRAVAGAELPIVVLMFGVYGLGLIAAARKVTGVTRLLAEHVAAHAGALQRARAEASDAHLAALRAQIDPHFLFNALNTVASLVRTDARVAESTVENLSSVLRRTLDRSQAAMSTLADEVDYVRAYLGVERARWGERLVVEWGIPEGLSATPVPSMTLQPLVENALKHGLGPRSAGGKVVIEAERAGGTLRLSVADDGIGLPVRQRDGLGLSNLRQRLDAIYDGLASLRLERLDAGARAVVELPVTGGRVA